MSMDGFVEAADCDMDWATDIFYEDMNKYQSDLIRTADTLLLGRKTYQSFAEAWPDVPDNPSACKGQVKYAVKLNTMKKFVFSRTLEKAEWNNTTIVKYDAVEEIKNLKKIPGKDMVIFGSLSIVKMLTNLGLIDEFQFVIHPVVLGNGKTLYEGLDKFIKLKLIKTKMLFSGAVILYYNLDRG
jgi:dihydrofolate reductase